MTFFCDGTLDVDRVLADIDIDTRPHPRLTVGARPETVPGPAPSALRFSAANWSGRTAAYRDAVQKRGSTCVCATFAAAQRRRVTAGGAERVASGVLLESACASSSPGQTRSC